MARRGAGLSRRQPRRVAHFVAERLPGVAALRARGDLPRLARLPRARTATRRRSRSSSSGARRALGRRSASGRPVAASCASTSRPRARCSTRSHAHRKSAAGARAGDTLRPMPLTIRDPEVMGVTASSVTLTFRVEDAAGPVAAPARVLVDGELRAVSRGPRRHAPRARRGARPGHEHTHRDRGGRRGEPASRDRYFPGACTTLPAPRARRRSAASRR